MTSTFHTANPSTKVHLAGMTKTNVASKVKVALRQTGNQGYLGNCVTDCDYNYKSQFTPEIPLSQERVPPNVLQPPNRVRTTVKWYAAERTSEWAAGWRWKQCGHRNERSEKSTHVLKCFWSLCSHLIMWLSGKVANKSCERRDNGR